MIENILNVAVVAAIGWLVWHWLDNHVSKKAAPASPPTTAYVGGSSRAVDLQGTNNPRAFDSIPFGPPQTGLASFGQEANSYTTES